MALSFTPNSMQVTTRASAIYDEHCNIDPPSSDPRIFISTGSGQTATMVSGTNGAYYEFASGTTANAETIVLFKQDFGVGAKIQLQCDRSVAAGSTNQETYIELVEVNAGLLQSSPATAVITSGTEVRVNNARNAFQVLWPASSATPQVWARRDGNVTMSCESLPLTGANVTIPIGTSPNFAPSVNYIFKLGNEGVRGVMANRSALGATTTSPTHSVINNTAPQQQSTSAHVPIDTSKRYALRIRIKNGASAPAASIITRVYRVTITEDSQLAVDNFAGGTTPFGSLLGNATELAHEAMPVRLTNAAPTGIPVQIASITAASALSVNSGYNGNLAVTASNTVLGVASEFNTGVLIHGALTGGLFVFHAVADQASAANGVLIECSNSTAVDWYPLATGTLVANVPLVLTARIAPVTTSANFFSRVRARVINGGVAQTKFSAVFHGGVIA